MSDDKSPKKNVDLNNYEDPIQMSPKNLEPGLWLANNRKNIYKLTIIILALFAAGFLIYSTYGYIYYFIFGREQDKALQNNTAGVDLNSYRQQNIPAELTLGQAKVINHGTGADYVVKLKNSNEKQSANFDFCFKSGEEKVCGSNFILPSEEKNIIVVGSSVKMTGNISFELTNIAWQKIKAGEIPDWNAFINSHLNFSFTDIKFAKYSDSTDYLEFNITNNSSYGYFEVPLNITVNQSGEVAAINRYVISGLSSHETKSVRLSWPEAANLGGNIAITPELNVLNNGIYKPYTTK